MNDQSRSFRRLWIAGLAAVALSCGGASMQPTDEQPLTDEEALNDEAPGDPAVPASAAEAEAAFHDFMREAQLELIPDDAILHEDVFRPVMAWKTKRGRALQAKWEEVLETGEPAASQLALLRIGQAYLNLGCEIRRSPVPSKLNEASREKYETVLAQSALEVLDQSESALKRALEIPTDDYRQTVDGVLAGWPDQPAEVADACQAKRDYWRPEKLADLSDVAASECEAGSMAFCWLSGAHGDGEEEALRDSCDGGFARACKTLGDRAVLADGGRARPAQAEAFYTKACRQGMESACRAQLAVVDPDAEDDYGEACLQSDDAVACLKYARLLDAGRQGATMWSRCSGAELPEQASVKEACAGGDAPACAILAGYLAEDGPYDIATPPPEKGADADALAIECIEGDDESCRAGANAIGNGPPSIRKRACATLLLLQACRRGDTDSCGFADVSVSIAH